ncbi:hypothetical protein DIPPA_17327 [Diplonema papillatum]|nr:hypothetical protein DIPPA_17327 [Diplonema papillatum]
MLKTLWHSALLRVVEGLTITLMQQIPTSRSPRSTSRRTGGTTSMCMDWTRTWSLCRRSGWTRRRQRRVRRSSGKSSEPGSTSPLPLERMGNGGLQAPSGGVAFHVRDRSTKVWQPPMGHAAEQRLWETGRWQHLAVPYGDGKRMLHLMTVYAHARGRARREELLEAVFEVAAGLGDVPVLVMGDWNTAVEDSPALRKAVSVGHWTDAALLDAQRRGRQPESTCSQADGGTRIDMVFANAAAVGAVQQVAVTRVPDVPTHSAVVVDLNLERLQATTGTVVRPAPIPAGSSMLSVEERGLGRSE